MSTVLPRYRNDLEQALIPEDGLEGRWGRYIPDAALIHAANTALILQMPLLLTGEPGCGKTDFAFVAAKALGHDKPLQCYVRSDTRARDLLYHYDALRRFGDSQHGDKQRALDPRHYIELRELGRGLMATTQQVVLIDEIDKAPRDLPNDLLRELESGDFDIMELSEQDGSASVSHPSDAKSEHGDNDKPKITLRRKMKRPDGALKPLVVITSNAERQLPEPFLRRCIFYHIPFPGKSRLERIVGLRFPNVEVPFVERAVRVFSALRKQHGLTKKPTTAELIDWVGALDRLYHADDVRGAVNGFASGLSEEGMLPKKSGLSWASLPALHCLLKLKEDLKTVAPELVPRG